MVDGLAAHPAAQQVDTALQSGVDFLNQNDIVVRRLLGGRGLGRGAVREATADTGQNGVGAGHRLRFRWLQNLKVKVDTERLNDNPIFVLKSEVANAL